MEFYHLPENECCFKIGGLVRFNYDVDIFLCNKAPNCIGYKYENADGIQFTKIELVKKFIIEDPIDIWQDMFNLYEKYKADKYISKIDFDHKSYFKELFKRNIKIL